MYVSVYIPHHAIVWWVGLAGLVATSRLFCKMVIVAHTNNAVLFLLTLHTIHNNIILIPIVPKRSSAFFLIFFFYFVVVFLRFCSFFCLWPFVVQRNGEWIQFVCWPMAVCVCILPAIYPTRARSLCLRPWQASHHTEHRIVLLESITDFKIWLFAISWVMENRSMRWQWMHGLLDPFRRRQKFSQCLPFALVDESLWSRRRPNKRSRIFHEWCDNIHEPKQHFMGVVRDYSADRIDLSTSLGPELSRICPTNDERWKE